MKHNRPQEVEVSEDDKNRVFIRELLHFWSILVQYTEQIEKISLKIWNLRRFYLNLSPQSKNNIMGKNEDTKNIVQLFSEGVKEHRQGDLPIIQQQNGKDCFILDIPPKDSELFKHNFLLDNDETILMARDTSTWNKRKEGLVITDKRLVYIPGKKDPHGRRYVIDFGSFIQVTYDVQGLLFWSSDENFFSIPSTFFFKSRLKSYDTDRAIHLLSKVLTKIARQNGGGGNLTL